MAGSRQIGVGPAFFYTGRFESGAKPFPSLTAFNAAAWNAVFPQSKSFPNIPISMTTSLLSAPPPLRTGSRPLLQAPGLRQRWKSGVEVRE